MKKRGAGDTGQLLEAAETSPFLRLVVNCFLAELHYLPFFPALTFPEKVAVERHLSAVLNLDRAVAEGLIDNYSIQWSRDGRLRTPSRVLLCVRGGLKPRLPEPLQAEFRRIRRHGLYNPRRTRPPSA